MERRPPPPPPPSRQPQEARRPHPPPDRRPEHVQSPRPPTKMRVQRQPNNAHDNISATKTHGLASWILLKACLDDSYFNNEQKFIVEEMVDPEEINRCSVSAINEISGEVSEKTTNEIGVRWMPILRYVDDLAQLHVPRFRTRAESWYPRLTELMYAVDNNVVDNNHGFDDFFRELGESLGDSSYIFNHNNKSYICEIDGYFLALAMKVLQNPNPNPPMAGLIDSLNSHTNLRAYVERVHQKMTRGPVIDFSENLVADINIKNRDDLLAKVKIPESATPLIGVGGFGEVFHCDVRENSLLGVQPGEYALKFSKRRTEVDIPELNWASLLQHERFPRFFAKGHTERICCTVLEFARDGDLRDLIEERQHAGVPAIREDNMAFTISILKDVIYGVHIMRTSCSEPLVHGDLWARNILISDRVNGRAQITDFGLLCYHGMAVGFHRTHGTDGKDDPCFINSGIRETENDIFTFGKIAMALLCDHIDPHGLHAREVYNARTAIVFNELRDTWGMPYAQAQLLLQLPLRCTGDRNQRPLPLDILRDLNSLIIPG